MYYGETAEEQRVRLGMQEEARRKAERFELLATPLWGTREVVPVVDTAPPDPNASLPDNAPIDEWMQRENERQTRRENERRKAETSRYGEIWNGTEAIHE